MAVPVLHLNLAPRPSLWRQRHALLGWIALGLGGLFLAAAIGMTWRAYHQANRAGRDAVSLTEEARRAGRQEQQLQTSLQDMDASREQSRWKLAERILQERSLPWSRLTAELEQCMVPDMRLKGIQRARSSAQQVVLKLKGEARTRQAEAEFVEALRITPVFAQVVLEREVERVGGGWDFEISLPAAAVPPPFRVKPIKQGPATPIKAGTPVRPPVAVPGRPIATAAARPAIAPPPPTHPAAPVKPAPLGVQARPAPVPPPADDDEQGSRRRRPARARPTDPRVPQ
ncbi:MAG: hypothetical protein HXX12_03455 [Geothrix sp.]|uniref:PilN domain-containing protein n=1 Tax=Geothrix sp. TaxID=1962974 RepID=UPI00179AD016|nr:hypothetical protein [Geothrix sp.]NWJ40014.1 hypothetical protein [Geothrix sp.]WIL21976.1 MAG: hypothetical protein QOZ81_001259 [Geothrix sp.]